MNDYLKHLSDLNNQIVALLIDIGAANKDLYKVNNEYQLLKEQERGLVDNINLLKFKKIIVAANEYGRATKDLKNIRNSLKILNNKYIQLTRTVSNLEDRHTELSTEYEELFRSYNKRKVVLPFTVKKDSGEK